MNSKLELPFANNKPESIAPVLDKDVFESLTKKAFSDIDKLPYINYLGHPSKFYTSEEKLSFHNIEHTKRVIDRYKRIVDFLKKQGMYLGSEREIQIGELGAAFHDVFQNCSIVDSKKEPPFVKDGKGDNVKNPFAGFEKKTRRHISEHYEKLSANIAVHYMRKINLNKPNSFNSDDEKTIEEQIKATVSKFNPKFKTVEEPNLSNKNISTLFIGRALAFSDIGAVGMDGGSQFIKEGNDVFKEDNIDIMDVIKSFKKDGKKISEQQKEYFRHRMIDWSKSELDFAIGRKELFNTEINVFSEEIQKKLKEEIFNKFDDSIKVAEEKLKQRESMSFEEIARDIGYVV